MLLGDSLGTMIVQIILTGLNTAASGRGQIFQCMYIQYIEKKFNKNHLVKNYTANLKEWPLSNFCMRPAFISIRKKNMFWAAQSLFKALQRI